MNAPSLQPIAVTLGDPCGIGPEIIAKAFVQAPDSVRHCFVVGDAGVMQRCIDSLVAGGHLARAPVLRLIADPGEARHCPEGVMALYQVGDAVPELALGQVHALAGRLAGDCVAWAAQAALEGQVAAMVTAPLHKEALSAAGAPYDAFPGHTELLQHAAARHAGCDVADMPVRMMLANEELRTVLVSIHVSLRRAIEAVTYANVLQTLQIAHRALGRMLGRQPRIAVAGLNPHAGEGGLFGDEEQQVIAPAIEAARRQGMRIEGPFPGDTVFMKARQSAASADPVDAVVAMYHDQGLIPVKYLGVENGVNVTLGLPLVRTSPDHGTAFDIAGRGLADPSSLLAAIRMARQLS
ncbi:4-hydroxythreonine-4-phosphate dehydrogenase PdxA [Curvibacter sp. APW13]|uniref:4-hydroxythreonine-4-phosphate dehydrogenase PdxA n=1 Tax=Curvibacter sp. APW13 TaxID=3077236 RepID=UPI0028DE6C25|nr:4-hydroxythreonine-4-phosphate dehydrogenase PdxA [Curvibacter sp. APW13]MDT8989546.1 4-hydroxythreonine-4-phosphate dehydrogenase PdxA [Curvibacter sp. APW13]